MKVTDFSVNIFRDEFNRDLAKGIMFKELINFETVLEKMLENIKRWTIK